MTIVWTRETRRLWTAEHAGHALAIRLVAGAWMPEVDGERVRASGLNPYGRAQEYAVRATVAPHPMVGDDYCRAGAGLPEGWTCGRDKYWAGHRGIGRLAGYTPDGLDKALTAIRDSTRAALGVAPPPAVQVVAAHVALFCGAEPAELIVRDRRWGDVRSAGAWSIAYEGGPDSWPVPFSDRAPGDGMVPGGWLLEAVNGVCLGMYPDGDR